MGDSLLSLNKSGNLSTGGLHGSLLNKSQRGSAAETPKRKSKPRKREVTGTALDEGQSKSPRKTKPRKQSKKAEVDVSDETSSDTRSSLPSCQNSAKLMQKVTIVGGNSCGGNTDSGSALNESPHNRNTPTGGTTTASPVASIPQLANALDGKSPKVNCITIKPVIKRCLNGNFITGSIRSGTILATNSLAGSANSTDIETRNTMTGNDSNDSTRNTIAVKTTNTSTGPGNTPTESTHASTSVARNATNGNSSGKNSQTRNFIVIHSVPRKAKTSVCSADKLQGITDSSGDSLSGQTEIDETSDTTVGSGLISKLTTDTIQFGQEKKPSQKFSVLPQLTTGKQLPLTLSLNVKQASSPVSDTNFPPFKRSKNTVIISGSQNKSEKFQSSNANFTQRIAIKLPVASTSGSSRQVPGNLSMIRSIKVVSASCHAGVSTSNIPAAITGIVPVTAGTTNSSAGVTSIASLTSASSSPLTSVSSSIVSAAHTGGRSLLNSCNDGSVVKTKFLASSSISVPSSQTLNTEQAAKSGPTKQVNIVVTSHSLSDDLKSSSTEGTKSQLDSAEMKPPKLRKTTKPRVKPTSTETRSSTSDGRNSLVGNCSSDGTASSLPMLKKTSVACKLDIKASAGEPAQMDGETSEPKCNEELSSWLAASMGLYTCPCGAAFSDNWSCHEHQINCSSAPSE